MMARSQRSKQKPDTLMQDRSPPTRRNLLATHGRTIHVGHSRLRWSRPRLVHVRFTSDSDRQPSKRDPSLRANKRHRLRLATIVGDSKAEPTGEKRPPSPVLRQSSPLRRGQRYGPNPMLRKHQSNRIRYRADPNAPPKHWGDAEVVRRSTNH